MLEKIKSIVKHETLETIENSHEKRRNVLDFAGSVLRRDSRVEELARAGHQIAVHLELLRKCDPLVADALLAEVVVEAAEENGPASE